MIGIEYHRKIRNWDDTYLVSIPKKMVERYGFKIGEKVYVRIEKREQK